ncbi:putative facilitated glucose [Diaporthe ampelina]|uniref:Putative facilitated glucose n=1 Tax=Diaporthe ampelina TaxID=1214573 RepID=A0A0G2FQ47_9PEZI|nr:putative facilitated glucose [Diaporthe ampelina]
MSEKTPHEVDHVGDTSGRRKSVAVNIVENPLRRHSAEQTVENARVFAETYGMSEHAALFGRAGLVARDPDRFDSVSELEEAERAALAYERDHKWHGPKMLWYSIGLCAVGAATQGWDQTGSNGANLSFPEEFGIDGEGRDEWIVGVINAIIFLTAGLIGAFIVDPLNHYFGRRGEIFITAACLTATPIGSGFARSWQGLFAARFVMGIGIGAKNATVPIYSAEMAPARVRGALVMFWQLWVVAVISFYSSTIFENVGYSATQALFIYLFTICYSLGEGPVAFQYSAEVFPTIQREQGMAWAVCINNTFVMTPTGAFGFYAGLNLIAWFMIFCFVRETKQLTLEEIDQVFSVPTKDFLSYELTIWLPYFIKRHILRQKIAKPPAIIEKEAKVESILEA